MLHQQLLQQQLASQDISKSNFNSLPLHIISTLDNMAYGISQKEDTDAFSVKQNLVKNVDNLMPKDLEYLEEQMSILINKSVHEGEEISDKNVDRDFISFLIRLYY